MKLEWETYYWNENGNDGEPLPASLGEVKHNHRFYRLKCIQQQSSCHLYQVELLSLPISTDRAWQLTDYEVFYREIVTFEHVEDIRDATYQARFLAENRIFTPLELLVHELNS